MRPSPSHAAKHKRPKPMPEQYIQRDPLTGAVRVMVPMGIEGPRADRFRREALTRAGVPAHKIDAVVNPTLRWTERTDDELTESPAEKNR